MRIEGVGIDRLAEQAHHGYQSVFGKAPSVVVFAPGRVNLIGEHTDYNEGLVLPSAIDRGVAIAGSPRSDGVVRAWAAAFDETHEALLSALAPAGEAGWFAYVAGVAWALCEAGHTVSGADLAIVSDLPMGVGLSSSAALEMATARVLAAASGIAWDGVAMARLCQRAENAFVGVACGIMDQLASALSAPGRALLLDCRSLQTEDVPIPSRAAIAVLDTAAPRTLAGSAYNDRRADCEAAVTAIRRLSPVQALRDVDRPLLEAARAELDPVVWRRAAHVVNENLRPALMAEALRAGDLAAAGRLMDESHESLRTLFEVSSRELDTMVDIARAQPGCFGARMTGAGFGGCAVALLERGAAQAFASAVEPAYHARVGRSGRVFLVTPAGGVRVVAAAAPERARSRRP